MPNINGKIGEILRYGANGVAATLTHAGALAILIHAGVHPAPANGMAFLCAVLVTYFGQRFWVFEAKPRSIPRFAAVVGMGLVLQTAGMWGLTTVGMPVAWAWTLLTVAVPTFSYLAMKAWVFVPRADSSEDRPTPHDTRTH